jgi:hypothetical protein
MQRLPLSHILDNSNLHAIKSKNNISLNTISGNEYHLKASSSRVVGRLNVSVFFTE